jgi:beta-phosphoglucomutase family hydrolase
MNPRSEPLVSASVGLPPTIGACLFDLDGVLTDTARVHAAAWKEMFDAYLHERATRRAESFVPFDAAADYDRYVDGRRRYDGVRAFLASRGIELPPGDASDPPARETIGGLGNRKNEIVLGLIRDGGVEAYPGSVRYLHAVRDAGLGRAVVSSSANCGEVLAAAGIDSLFEVRIDGVVAEREHLRGKPAPDTYLAAAQALGVRAPRAAVFEDALAGVAAGRAGRFGVVVGVDRVGQVEALRAHGADVVVTDLADLLERA